MSRALGFLIQKVRPWRHEAASTVPGRYIPWLALVAAAGSVCVAWLHHAGLPPERGQATVGPAWDYVVCIDPGHPTATSSGRAVYNGVSELDVNWGVALKLGALLSKDKRIRVVWTRESRDQPMENSERAKVANEAHADLSVHLHCDVGPSRGFTVYFPDRQGTVAGKTGPAEEVLRASREAAHALRNGMARILRGVVKDRGIRTDCVTRVGHLNGSLTTSIFSEVPTVTVEMVFLSDRHDARFIKTRQGQERMARAIVNGVTAYLRSTSQTARRLADAASDL